jgi:chemotaxis protein CheD
MQVKIIVTGMGVVCLTFFTRKELENMIEVGMADFKTAVGDKKFLTRDLGSCVAVALRDGKNGVGGLLHLMLACAPTRGGIDINPAKYADTGIDVMLGRMLLQGAKKEFITAKIIGAAHMVKTEEVSEDKDISSRNLIAVKRKLGSLNIPILASAVGGHHPRTVVFETRTGSVRLITSGMEDRYI